MAGANNKKKTPMTTTSNNARKTTKGPGTTKDSKTTKSLKDNDRAMSRRKPTNTNTKTLNKSKNNIIPEHSSKTKTVKDPRVAKVKDLTLDIPGPVNNLMRPAPNPPDAADQANQDPGRDTAPSHGTAVHKGGGGYSKQPAAGGGLKGCRKLQTDLTVLWGVSNGIKMKGKTSRHRDHTQSQSLTPQDPRDLT